MLKITTRRGKAKHKLTVLSKNPAPFGTSRVVARLLLLCRLEAAYTYLSCPESLDFSFPDSFRTLAAQTRTDPIRERVITYIRSRAANNLVMKYTESCNLGRA